MIVASGCPSNAFRQHALDLQQHSTCAANAVAAVTVAPVAPDAPQTAAVDELDETEMGDDGNPVWAPAATAAWAWHARATRITHADVVTPYLTETDANVVENVLTRSVGRVGVDAIDGNSVRS